MNKFYLSILALLQLQVELSALSDSHKCHRSNVYDYVIVGAGNVGAVIANRLSEDPNITVCILEAGRDDARISIEDQKLPKPSNANIPQPGQYDWQQYIRGGAQTIGPLYSRGFLDWWFFQRYTPDPNSRSINYNRSATWGGCTSHNQGIAVRQSPYNWDQWVELGLTDWSADNMIQWYKKAENRSQIAAPFFGGKPYYTSSIPIGTLGNFDPTTDGENGYVPTLYTYSQFVNPNFTIAMNNAILNLNIMGFSYRDPYTVPGPNPSGFNMVDIGTQDRTLSSLGGLGTSNLTLVDQYGHIKFPGSSTLVPMATYNQALYGDNGFVYPPELAPFGQTGLALFERVSSASTYLYAAESRKNLTIKSKALVTQLILDKKGKNPKVKGVKYLKGWNIYQTGRNPNALTAGYGGSPGDAKANAIKAKNKGIEKVYARKEVILSAGVFNTPQIMMLSGLGPKEDLESLGIKCLKDIPGLGQNLTDNAELFIVWQTNPETPPPTTPISFTLAAKSTPSTPTPDFDILFVQNVGDSNQQVLEATDYTIQNGWLGLRSPGAVENTFVRNNPGALLLDFSPGKTQNGPDGPIGYFPAMFDTNHTMFSLTEKEVFNSTKGYMKLQSKNPTIPPYIVFNANNDIKDIQDMYNTFYNNVLPTMLSLHNPVDPTNDYFYGLIDPMPSDILKPGLTQFTSMSDIDTDRLYNFIANRIAGHHACGTCKMGLKTDPMAVVDQHARVYGVKNLRIADMSILPGAIRWPNLNLYPIGEQIAHFILTD